MASTVIDVEIHTHVRFYESSIGKKTVMAVTGAMLCGYVLAHMIGNLQVFVGREQINGYAELLHAHPLLLWVARVVLLAAVGLHMFTALQLWLLKRQARPIGYYKQDRLPPGYASRTMLWTGPLLAAYVVYHVMHLTLGDVGLPFRPLDAYDNVVAGFQVPAVSAAYVAAMLILSIHLYHGVWSLFQSLGVSHPRYTPLLKRLSAAVAILVAAGFISIPVAVVTGLIS
jgi:succinate dehydrogenase / fumarate reductase, cytochrome b subunit